MNYIQRTLAALAIAGLASPAAADWGDNYQAARVAMKDKNFQEAETVALTAFEETQRFKADDPRRLQSLELLADIYRETRQWATAADLLNQIVASMEKAGTDNSQDASFTFNKLGVTYQQMLDYDNAEKAYEKALQIRRRNYRDNAASVALVVSNLGDLYRRQGKLDKAEELHKQSIADKEGELGPNHYELIASLANLALVYKDQQRYDEAQKLLERARDIPVQRHKEEQLIFLATAINNLGEIASLRGDFETAQQSFESALNMRKRHLKEGHPEVATTLNGLGALALKQRQYDEAIKYFDQAIEIRKAEFGLEDPRTLVPLKNKAYTLELQGNLEEAEALQQQIKGLEAN